VRGWRPQAGGKLAAIGHVPGINPAADSAEIAILSQTPNT
jgi:hypothetical protein